MGTQAWIQYTQVLKKLHCESSNKNMQLVAKISPFSRDGFKEELDEFTEVYQLLLAIMTKWKVQKQCCSIDQFLGGQKVRLGNGLYVLQASGITIGNTMPSL